MQASALCKFVSAVITVLFATNHYRFYIALSGEFMFTKCQKRHRNFFESLGCTMIDTDLFESSILNDFVPHECFGY